jgi:hypothetical protein
MAGTYRPTIIQRRHINASIMGRDAWNFGLRRTHVIGSTSVIYTWEKMMSVGCFQFCDTALTGGVPCQMQCENGLDMGEFRNVQSIFRARFLNWARKLGMVGFRGSRVVGTAGPLLWYLTTVDLVPWGVPFTALVKLLSVLLGLPGALPTPPSTSMDRIPVRIPESSPLVDALPVFL